MRKKMGDFKLRAPVGLRDESLGTVCDDAHLFTTIKYLYFLRSYTLSMANSHGVEHDKPQPHLLLKFPRFTYTLHVFASIPSQRLEVII